MFFSARSNLCNILNRKLLPRKVFVVSGCKILRTIQKIRFEYLKLTPLDKKVLFLAIIFAQKQTFY
jgi:hypothetical protein